MAKNPDNPKKPVKTPKSKAHRPDVQPIGPALAELLNPAINRGEAGLGSGTGLRPPPDNSKDRRSGGEAAVHRAAVRQAGLALAAPPPPAAPRGGGGRGTGTGLRPPPDNSKDRRSGGEAAVHRARASTRGTSDDVAKRDAGAAHRDAATQRD